MTIPRIIFLVILLSGRGPAVLSDSLPKGLVIDALSCTKAPDQSYALYLPPQYAPEKKWPVLYCFDPRARGKIPVELFQKSAAALGYIVVGSNNAQNGPWEPIIRSMIAVWNDTHERFSLNDDRVYAAGFSGGARAVSLFGRLMMIPVAGVIACGAGLSPDIQPADVKPTYFLGTCGFRDFNYPEMRGLESRLKEARVGHRFIYFNGRHAWPPEDICTAALGWLELQAMASGRRPPDRELADELIASEWRRGEEREESGNAYRAWMFYNALAPLLGKLDRLETVQQKIYALTANPDFRRSAEEEDRYLQKESEMRSLFSALFSAIRNTPPGQLNLVELMKEFQIFSLLKSEKTTASAPKADWAQRQLIWLITETTQTGWDYLRKEKTGHAVLVFTIGLNAASFDATIQPVFHFYLACAHASGGAPKKALDHLEEAVKGGFDDKETIEAEPYLESLRRTEDYRKLLAEIKKH